MDSFLTGLLLGGSLIIAIGSQNAYVLKQGLMRSHIFIICLICSLSDALLITIGTTGIGTIIEKHPDWLRAITWFGAIYLFIFGTMSFRAALSNQTLDAASTNPSQNIKIILGTVLALTFLNPHVYLDTVLLIGSIASPYANNERFYFTLGAISASFIWFFALVLQPRYIDGYRANQSVQDKAWVADNGYSLVKTHNAVLDALVYSRRASQKAVIHVVALFVKGATIHCKVRLVANRFLTRCIHQYNVVGVQGYGTRLLIPLFKKPSAWKFLNSLIGIIMWWIAYSLIKQ